MSVMAWVSAAEPDLQQKMLQNISTFVTKIFGPAAEDVVRDGGELVRDPVGHPRAHAGPAVRPNHHSAIKLHCTQSCSRGHLNNEHSHIFMILLQYMYLPLHIQETSQKDMYLCTFRGSSGEMQWLPLLFT